MDITAEHPRRVAATRDPADSAITGLASSSRPTWRQAVAESVPIVDAPAFFGPPVIFVLGPWLLVVLVLIGPLALIFTLVLAVLAAGVLMTALVGVVASPYLLMRHLHSHGGVRVRRRASVQPLPIYRARSSRLGSTQPKGVS